ncbi:MAG: UDP-N-acetylglucosamine 1-carboxyvinyltransferase [Myxococcota bacterium]
MDALRIRGGKPLRGEIQVSGSKNASLPIMAASLLASGESVLRGTPDLTDVRTLGALLRAMGCGLSRDGDAVKIDASAVDKPEAHYDLVRTMRASILVLGPLLARFGKARVSLPGGCAIGARPIDQHLKALERLGAEIRIEHGYVEASASKLVGAEVVFDVPTVGGTENLMLAASLAKGTTVLRNVAREPEIVDLATALIAMGAEIEGAGSQCITIHGRDSLKPYDHKVIPDRIELGTFLVAGAMVGDPVVVVGGIPDHQAALIDKLRQSGVEVEIAGDRVRVCCPKRHRAVDVHTAPFPGFPTDMQAQLMAFLSLAEGTSHITETVFENRFMHVAELDRFGASIRVDGGRAIVHGVERLSGSIVMATDLRASACLVLAGLVADGETVVRRVYHLDRGYERIGKKLGALGADIERFSE